MAAPSDSTLLIANEEAADLDGSEDHSANEGLEHRSQIKVLIDRLYPVLKLLRIWWKTLVIVLTPLLLLLLLKFIDTRVRGFYVVLCFYTPEVKNLKIITQTSSPLLYCDQLHSGT